MAERVGTVLVVDDSEFDLRLLAHSVGALGYTVLTAGSAAEAVNRVFDAGSAVDVVLSDIRMEPIDGFGLVDQLQARLPDLPVILVTAQATTDLVIQAVKRRVLDVLVKPVDPAMLASTLATAMRRRELVTTDRTLIETLHRTIDEQTAEIERRLVSHEAEHAELKRVFRQVQEIKAEWERTMDCVSDMVLLIGPDGRLRRCNRAWRDFTGQPYSEILGVSWKELFVRLGLETRTGFAPGCELQHAASGRWFVYREAPFEAVCQEVNAKTHAYWHVWKPTDMLIWDNWRMLHAVEGCDPKYERRMQRTTIKGDYGLGYFEDGKRPGEVYRELAPGNLPA